MVDRVGNIAFYLVGLALVLLAIWILFTQTGLEDYVPIGVVAGVLLLVVGLGVMASSDRFGLFRDRTVVVDRAVDRTYPHAYAPPATRTVEREYVTESDRYPPPPL